MQHDKTKFLLSVIATVVSIAFILIYCLAPATPESHPLYKLFFDCIPDTLVVLIAIPVVYWLFYRRGLTTMGDCPLFIAQGQSSSGHHHHRRHRVPLKTPGNQQEKPIDKKLHPAGNLDILIVTGIQSVSESERSIQSDIDEIATPLDAALRIAQAKNMLVIFTKAPTIQASTERNGKTLFTNSKTKTNGLYKPDNSIILELDSSDITPDYTALDMLISHPNVCTIYVAGIYLEFNVKAVCLRALKHGKTTVALVKAITSKSKNTEEVNTVWQSLTSQGIVIQENFPAIVD